MSKPPKKSKKDLFADAGAMWLDGDEAEEGESPPPPNQTLGDASAGLWGSRSERTGRREKLHDLSIHDVLPSVQARRSLPAAMRQNTLHPDTIAETLGEWENLAAAEANTDQDSVHRLVIQIVNGEDTDRSEGGVAGGPIMRSLIRIAVLAEDINRAGLINPITVYERDNQYYIETGERRWIAHHMLHLLQPEAGWDKIKTREITYSVWRQASENNVRDDLTAVEKARLIAMLIMDMYPEAKLHPESACENELIYFSQVADGQTFRVKRGKGDKLLNAVGLDSRYQLVQYRNLLRLPYPVWLLADDLEWSEGFLRQLLAIENVDEMINRATRKAVGEGYLVESLGLERPAHIDKLHQAPTPAAVRQIESAVSATIRVKKKDVTTLSHADREALRAKIAQARQRLEEIDSWF
jgi:hypothetical protein